MRSTCREGWKWRYSGDARANNNDAFVGIVEIIGPELGANDLALEIVYPRNVGRSGS